MSNSTNNNIIDSQPIASSSNTPQVLINPDVHNKIVVPSAAEATPQVSGIKKWLQAMAGCILPCIPFAEAAAENAINALPNLNDSTKHILDGVIQAAGADIQAVLGAFASGDSNIKDVLLSCLKTNTMNLGQFVEEIAAKNSPLLENYVISILDKKVPGLTPNQKSLLIQNIKNTLESQKTISLAIINDAINHGLKSAVITFAKNTEGNIANTVETLLAPTSDAVKQLILNTLTNKMTNCPDAEKTFMQTFLLSAVSNTTASTETTFQNFIDSHYGAAIEAYRASITVTGVNIAGDSHHTDA